MTNEHGDVIRAEYDNHADGVFEYVTEFEYDTLRRVVRTLQYEDGHLHLDERFDYDAGGRLRRREATSLGVTVVERWSWSCP